MFLEDEEIYEGGTPQREKEIEIPEFLKRRDTGSMELPTEEQLMAQAMLNNVPNNTDIEEQNHLNELENVAQNWKEEEWTRVLYYAPHTLMNNEIERRMSASEEFRNAMKDADEVMRRLKL